VLVAEYVLVDGVQVYLLGLAEAELLKVLLLLLLLVHLVIVAEDVDIGVGNA
jgi:hypothetical protein